MNRSVSFIHYLRELGYSCKVLTTSAFGGCGDALRAWEPISFYRWLFNRKVRSGILDSENRIPRGLLSRFLRRFLVPDAQVFWIPMAFILGLLHIKKQRCDLIYSSFPPASGHLIACFLHVCTGLPWVADFRDSWIFDPLDSQLKKFKWRLDLEQFLEKKIIKNATVVITATEESAQALRCAYPSFSGKINVIHNGYDSDIAPSRFVKLESGALILVHTGSFSYSHSERTPTHLFKALHRLVEEDPIWSERICVVLAGAMTEEEKFAAIELIQAGMVRLEGVVDSTEVRNLQERADVLLVVDHVRPWLSTNIPGKFFEYLAMRKPILSIGGDGAVKNLLCRLNAGRHVNGQDTAAIVGALKEFYFAGRRGILTCKTNTSEIAQFHRGRETQQLADYFDKAIKGLCCQ